MRRLFPLIIPSCTHRAISSFQNPAYYVRMMLRTLVHEQKAMACLQCLAYVKPVHIPPFLFLFLDSHYCFGVISDFHAEIVKDHATPDFLYDELSLSGMKVLRSQCHLEKPERGFDSLAFKLAVEAVKHRRKCI